MTMVIHHLTTRQVMAERLRFAQSEDEVSAGLGLVWVGGELVWWLRSGKVAAGWMRLAGWLVSWLVGWLVGWLFVLLMSLFNLFLLLWGGVITI